MRWSKQLKWGHVTYICKGSQCVLFSVLAKLICAVVCVWLSPSHHVLNWQVFTLIFVNNSRLLLLFYFGDHSRLDQVPEGPLSFQGRTFQVTGVRFFLNFIRRSTPDALPFTQPSVSKHWRDSDIAWTVD